MGLEHRFARLAEPGDQDREAWLRRLLRYARRVTLGEEALLWAGASYLRLTYETGSIGTGSRVWLELQAGPRTRRRLGSVGVHWIPVGPSLEDLAEKLRPFVPGYIGVSGQPLPEVFWRWRLNA